MRMRIMKKEQDENEMRKMRMRIIKKEQDKNEMSKNENENN